MAEEDKITVKTFAEIGEAMKLKKQAQDTGGYGTRAKEFDESRPELPADDWRFQWLKEMLKMSPKDAAVLDLGCGTGVWTRGLKSAGFEKVVGVDGDQEMLARALKKQDRIPYHHAFANKLPFADESFDAIVINWAFDIFGHDTQSIAEIRRVLKNDGVLMIGTTTVEGFSSKRREILMPFAPHGIPERTTLVKGGESCATWLQKYGFRDIETRSQREIESFTLEAAYRREIGTSYFNDVPVERWGEAQAAFRAYLETESKKDPEGLLRKPKTTIIDVCRK